MSQTTIKKSTIPDTDNVIEIEFTIGVQTTIVNNDEYDTVENSHT